MPEGRSKSPTGKLTQWLGRVIATERAQQGLTVAELARRAKVSTGLVSQLERGLGNPSMETVANLARALKVPIGSFFAGAAVEGNVVRRDERKRLALGNGSLVYEMLVPDLSGRLSMLSIELPPHFTNEHAPFQHLGEEALVVLTGIVDIYVDGSHIQLREGDSIRIDAALPHWYTTGTEPVRVISAMTPPSF